MFMQPHKKIGVLLCVLPLVFGACVNLKQPRNKIEFYTLEYNPPRIGTFKPLAFVIKVERFSVAPIFNTNRIIYRDGSFKRNSYQYHRWRANPGDFVSHFLGRDIKQSGLFKAVISYDSRFPCSYILEGSVDQFLEWDREDQWQAVLSVTITLMADKEPDVSRRILFQQSYRSSKPCKQKHPRALTEAMSQAMSEISGQTIKDIYTCLKDREPRSGK
jgi:ABC-type uncharacterized transport system auxiliary subunit